MQIWSSNKKRYVGVLISCAMASLPMGGDLLAQTPTAAPQYGSGTCAVAGIAPFGAVFVIDSRLTITRAGKLVSQSESCKIRQPRPQILLAATGISESDGSLGIWRSLDIGEALVQQLPQDPSLAQLGFWAKNWAESLIQRYRSEKSTPTETGTVAELLLFTAIAETPVFHRTTVSWDGSKFTMFFDKPEFKARDIQFSGLCRLFVTHNSDAADARIPASALVSSQEKMAISWDGNRIRNASTYPELLAGALELEEDLTNIDARIEGDHAEVAPPYARAKWDTAQSEWIVSPNPACTKLKDFQRAPEK